MTCTAFAPVDLTGVTCPENLRDLFVRHNDTPEYNAVLGARPKRALASLPKGWPVATEPEPEETADPEPEVDPPHPGLPEPAEPITLTEE